MSAETCGGYVPIQWTFYDQGKVSHQFFIRSDKEICKYERWSLFQAYPEYKRILIMSTSFARAFELSRKEINKILDNDE